MQSVLQHHLTHDGNSDLQSRQISFFEQNDPAPDKVDALGWNGWWTICQMRRAADRVFQRHPIGIAVYHNCWGVPFLADLDGATRRLSYVHGIPPDMEACLQAQNGLLDGILAVSQAQLDLAARCLPKLSPERFCLVPLPINPKTGECPHSPLKNRPVTIGYSGRLVKAIKRVDRLPELVRCLSDAGVDFRLEILGSGCDGPWLKKQFGGNQKILFHGAKSGDDYWNILGSWDLQINSSDSEGTPVSVLEGLSCGVIPIFPRIDSGGVDYTRRVDPSLVYKPGDMAAAAQCVRHLAQMPAGELDSLRVKCRQAVQAHTPDAYQKTFRSFIAGIDALPRISQDAFDHRPFHLTDHLPLGILSRMLPASLFNR
jgi:glycosyltransferase involved in cell wall biosynthesis